jgi:hypothetical protein
MCETPGEKWDKRKAETVCTAPTSKRKMGKKVFFAFRPFNREHPVTEITNLSRKLNKMRYI